jgi:hypothetical protein
MVGRRDDFQVLALASNRSSEREIPRSGAVRSQARLTDGGETTEA